MGDLHFYCLWPTSPEATAAFFHDSDRTLLILTVWPLVILAIFKHIWRANTYDHKGKGSSAASLRKHIQVRSSRLDKGERKEARETKTWCLQDSLPRVTVSSVRISAPILSAMHPHIKLHKDSGPLIPLICCVFLSIKSWRDSLNMLSELLQTRSKTASTTSGPSSAPSNAPSLSWKEAVVSDASLTLEAHMAVASLAIKHQR